MRSFSVSAYPILKTIVGHERVIGRIPELGFVLLIQKLEGKK